MGGAAGTEEYRNTEFLMKKLLKWLWYSVLGLAALAIVLIILFFILIFVAGPPVNEESDERNTAELSRDIEANFEAKVSIKLPKDYETLLVSSYTQPTVDHEVEYNLIVKSSPEAIQKWTDKSKPFGKEWTTTQPTETDSIKHEKGWRPMKIGQLKCQKNDEKLEEICNFFAYPTEVSFSFNRIRIDHYQILISSTKPAFIWLQDVKF